MHQATRHMAIGRKAIWLLVMVMASPALGQQGGGQQRGRRSGSNDELEGPPVPARLRRQGRRSSRRSSQTRRPSRSRGSQPPAEAVQAQREAFAAVRDMHTQARKLGKWEDQYAVISGATNLMFERNGWNNNTDMFAKELSLEVSRIPPWDNRGRFDKFIQTMGKRYRLDEKQEKRLRSLMAWESMSFFMKHAPHMIEQGREVLETRGRAEPFTPEQVARWSKNGRPMLLDWQERLSSISESMLPHLRPDQVKTIRQDLQSWDGRVSELSDKMKHWEQGEWSPEDWGLDADPIHAQARAGSRPDRPAPQQPPLAAGKAPPKPQDGKPDPLFQVAQNETEWERYVRQFIGRYKLDNSQSTTALSILDQLRDRAVQMREGRADTLARLDELILGTKDAGRKAGYVKDRADVLSPIRTLFDELKSRLDNLLTDAQRKGGGAPKPAKG